MGNKHSKTNKEVTQELIDEVAEEQKIKRSETVIAFLGAKGSGKSTIINTIVKQYSCNDTKCFLDSKYNISTCTIYERTDPIIEKHAAKSLKYLDLIIKYGDGEDDAKYIASKIGSKQIREAWFVFIKDYDLLFIGYMHEIEKELDYDCIPTPMDIISLIHKYYPSKSIVTSHKIRVKQNVYDLWEINEEELDMMILYKFIDHVIFVTDPSKYDAFDENNCNKLIHSLDLFKKFDTEHGASFASIYFLQNKMDRFREKIIDIPLSKCPLWSNVGSETNTYDLSLDRIFERYLLLCKRKCLQRHVVCGTDAQGLSKVFQQVIGKE